MPIGRGHRARATATGSTADDDSVRSGEAAVPAETPTQVHIAPISPSSHGKRRANMTGPVFRAGSHLRRPDQRRCRRKLRGRDSISQESAESFRAGFNSANREAMQIGEPDQEVG
jgi:hypothetical protein